MAAVTAGVKTSHTALVAAGDYWWLLVDVGYSGGNYIVTVSGCW